MPHMVRTAIQATKATVRPKPSGPNFVGLFVLVVLAASPLPLVGGARRYQKQQARTGTAGSGRNSQGGTGPTTSATCSQLRPQRSCSGGDQWLGVGAGIVLLSGHGAGLLGLQCSSRVDHLVCPTSGAPCVGTTGVSRPHGHSHGERVPTGMRPSSSDVPREHMLFVGRWGLLP